MLPQNHVLWPGPLHNLDFHSLVFVVVDYRPVWSLLVNRRCSSTPYRLVIIYKPSLLISSVQFGRYSLIVAARKRRPIWSLFVDCRCSMASTKLVMIRWLLLLANISQIGHYSLIVVARRQCTDQSSFCFIDVVADCPNWSFTCVFEVTFACPNMSLFLFSCRSYRLPNLVIFAQLSYSSIAQFSSPRSAVSICNRPSLSILYIHIGHIFSTVPFPSIVSDSVAHYSQIFAVHLGPLSALLQFQNGSHCTDSVVVQISVKAYYHEASLSGRAQSFLRPRSPIHPQRIQ